MRFVWGVLGFMFLLLGTMFTVISFFLFFRHGHVMLLAGAITSIIPMGVGVIVLTIGAYNVTCDDKQITLAFVFRTESVPWELVKCYQKLFIGWSLRGKGPEIDAGVLILLKYLRAKSRSPDIALARIVRFSRFNWPRRRHSGDEGECRERAFPRRSAPGTRRRLRGYDGLRSGGRA